MNFIRLTCLSVLFLTVTVQAAPSSKNQTRAYRAAILTAKQALRKHQPQLALQTVKPYAEQGYAEAQYILATLYSDGVPSETYPNGNPDLAEAERWYTAAAKNNNPEVAKLAQEALSEMH